MSTSVPMGNSCTRWRFSPPLWALALYADTFSPTLTLVAPPDGALLNTSTPTLELEYGDIGSGVDPETLSFQAGGMELAATCTQGEAGATCTPTDALPEGKILLTTTIQDYAGNFAKPVEVYFTIDTIPPAIILTAPIDGTLTRESVQLFVGSLSEAASLTLNGEAIFLGPSYEFSHGPLLLREGTNTFELLATDAAFLYTGNHPIQTGVAPGTIEPRRAAVLRGKVFTRDGLPLSEVTLTVLDHPEFGQTLSRADGMFDLAVNGGGQLTVYYAKEGYLPVQRQLQVPWQDYAWLPGVVMIPLDPQVSAIDLTAATDFQVAQGSLVTDADGMRAATLLFPPGTQATLMLPDGTSRPLSTLHVRATEYTVGKSGPQAMPAELPPNSGYTYAVEFSSDEALAAGATEVQFNPPLISYVENFLNFPVGGIVPVGYYDRAQKGCWVPSDNGRVIQVLGHNNGMAELDTNGDGVADDAATLAALGITEAERQRLAPLYPPGQSLWRVSIAHFTPWDYNWPYGSPDDAEGPGQGAPSGDDPLEDSCELSGSTIECQNQILGEAAILAGTPFSLHYRSDRVPGRKAAYTLEIPLSRASLPASLKRIELETSVAGRRFTQSFPPAPNQKYTFTWDGQNAYGRTLQGTQPVTIRIGYVYEGVYQQPAQFARSFAAFSGVPITGNRARQEITLWQEWQGLIGSWDSQAHGLGGVEPERAPCLRSLKQGALPGRRRTAQRRSFGPSYYNDSGERYQWL
ncbi:MAG: hypothetical protein HY673_26550 [Chloroflexi bacterium]|nr:hypothetical protein [Chloroflexota bacterium]